jgi:hypothetical protein
MKPDLYSRLVEVLTDPEKLPLELDNIHEIIQNFKKYYELLQGLPESSSHRDSSMQVPMKEEHKKLIEEREKQKSDFITIMKSGDISTLLNHLKPLFTNDYERYVADVRLLFHINSVFLASPKRLESKILSNQLNNKESIKREDFEKSD